MYGLIVVAKKAARIEHAGGFRGQKGLARTSPRRSVPSLGRLGRGVFSNPRHEHKRRLLLEPKGNASDVTSNIPQALISLVFGDVRGVRLLTRLRFQEQNLLLPLPIAGELERRVRPGPLFP